MRVLHICNDYLGSKVHANLYRALKDVSVQQTVYYPLRTSTVSKNIDEDATIETISGFQLKRYHKVLFRKKISDLIRDVFVKIDFKKVDLVHATTLFSDGAIAYGIYQKYGLPYVVAIRNTDTDLFLKLRPDLFFLVKEILMHATRIIFIGNAIKDNFFAHTFIKTFKTKISYKTEVIYNGIDMYWLQNIRKVSRKQATKIMYVGVLDNNKNVLRLVKAFLQLKKTCPDLELNLIGNKGSQLEQIKHIAGKEGNGINYLGPIYKKEELLKVYRDNHIFAMASKRETFGLVYLEALSQGLPLLFSRAQGVDGIFKENIGEAVDPYSVGSIKNGLERLLTNYGQYTAQVDFSCFDWSYIAKRYKSLYNDILNETNQP